MVVYIALGASFEVDGYRHEYGISKAYVHCFMDGRDTDPKSGKGFIETLENHLKTTGGKIASIIGRYYAMDATNVGSA